MAAMGDRRLTGVAAVVELSLVPLSPATRAVTVRDAAILPILATGGDDYELLFAAPPEADEEITSLSRSLGLPITAIGTFETGHGVRLIDAAGQDVPIGAAGWRHF